MPLDPVETIARFGPEPSEMPQISTPAGQVLALRQRAVTIASELYDAEAAAQADEHLTPAGAGARVQAHAREALQELDRLEARLTKPARQAAEAAADAAEADLGSPGVWDAGIANWLSTAFPTALERVVAVREAIAAGDKATARVAFSAPPSMRLFDADQIAELKDLWASRAAPERHAHARALGAAVESSRSAIATARRLVRERLTE